MSNNKAVEATKDQDSPQREISIYLKLAKIRKFNQVALGTNICFYLSLILYITLMYGYLIFWFDILLTILFWFFLGLSFIYSFTDDPIDRIKPGITLLGNIVFGALIFMMAIFSWWNFAEVLPIAYVISMFLFLALFIGGILTVVTNIYVLFYRHKCKTKKINIFNIYRTGKIKKPLLIAIIATGLPVLIFSIPKVIQIPITITPQDYQVEIAFWGGYGLNDSDICEQLNNHETILFQCCFDDIYDDKGKQKLIDFYTFYNNTYPNIEIYLSVTAEPGLFVWDGNTEEIIDHAKNLIKVAQENNLTNIKGLTFDIEAPYFPYFGYQPDYENRPNRKRHDDALELWDEFFDWKKKRAPEMEIQAINYVEAAIDVLDKDYDIQYIRRFSFLDIDTDQIEEYTTMSYRCMYSGTKPYGDQTNTQFFDLGHYWFYTQMDLLAKSLDERFGNHDKMGAYLGVTNCSCYGSDYVQYQNWEEAGNGYDSLVRDALIAKHFKAKRITIFLLETVIENGYSMGGVFDSYGDDFLDDFNESVNGEDSTDSFQIWYRPRFNYYLSFGHMDTFIYDGYANLNSIFGIIYVSSLFMINIYVANKGWKKIKSRVLAFSKQYDKKNQKKKKKKLKK